MPAVESPPPPPEKPTRRKPAGSAADPAGGTDKDIWIAIGELRQSDKQQAGEIAAIKHDIHDLKAQGNTHTAQLAGIGQQLAVLPAIQAAFAAWQAERTAEEARAASRSRAISTIMAKNTALVAGVFGLVVASILQRLGAIPVPVLLAVGGLLGLYFVVDTVRTLGRTP